jgi:pimeloyl-ACP methyl ester carboxylesterase
VHVEGAPLPTWLRRYGVGGSDDPAILLVPGLSAGPFGFTVGGGRSLVRVLTAAGRTVWTVELAYSLSGRTRQDFSAVVESVRRGIAHLREGTSSDAAWSFDAIGHSLGGLVLLALAATGAPIRRLVTLSTALEYHTQSWSTLAPLARLGELEPRRRSPGGGIPVELLSRLTAPLFGRLVPMFFQEGNFHRGSTDGALIRSVVAGSMRDLPLPLLASIAGLVLPEGLMWGDPKQSLTEAAAKLTLPVLMIAGRQDRQCPLEGVRRAVQLIPEARLLEVGTDEAGLGFGHYDVITGTRAAEVVFAPMLEFLA